MVHTPGPWTYTWDNKPPHTYVNVAQLIGPDGNGVGISAQILSGYDLPPEIAEKIKSNIALAAAAPDLLEACKVALDFCEHADFDFHNGVSDPSGTMDEGEYYGGIMLDEVKTKLRSAIAKAETK